MGQIKNTNQGAKTVELLERKYKINLDELIADIKSYNKDFNEDKFRQAFRFAAVAHDGQLRKQEGLPYIIHPLETAKILTQIHADETTLIASLLHDVPEDTAYTLEQIERHFGKQVAYLVEGITKLSKVHYRDNMQQREVESMKKLFIHVAEDPRTMLIKLADRLHNMRTLEYMDVPEKRLRKARETLEIFTPIANLLGIKKLQIELEDLCFQNLFPEDFAQLKQIVYMAREQNQRLLTHKVEEVENILKENGIDAIVFPNENNLYDIYKRLKKENKTIQDYEISFYVTVIVHEVHTCYEALGIIHSLFKPKPGSFKDYIALPKASGYQSLHTTVFGENGVATKFYIRTNQMHFEAQYGIAASYFDNKNKKKKITAGSDPRSQWVEEVIQLQNDQNAQSRYFDDLKQFVFQDRITVLTPKGKVIDLPSNATCIDFAYCIHTQVGHRAIRAVVNDQNVPLSYELKKGDVVKIITTDYAKSPSYEWLSFAKTPVARKKMGDYFKKETTSAKVNTGRKMLQKEYDRAGLGLVNNLSKWKITKVAQSFPWTPIKKLDDIFICLAEGTISTLELVNLIQPSALNIEDIAQQGVHKWSSIIGKLTRFRIKIVCEPSINLTKIAEVWQKHRDSSLLVSADSRYDFWSGKINLHATMYVKSYNEISNISREIEQIDGVKEVSRLFWTRKIVFFLGSVFTFTFWAIHPFLLYVITSEWKAPAQQIRIVANAVLYSGLVVLFSLIFILQQYTEKSFPELRETNRLFQVAYVLSFFALVTIFLEIYLYKLQFDWAWVLAAVVLIFAYLTGQYIYFKDKKKV